MPKIKPISLGGVNCYLLTVDGGFILIDTGFSMKRASLEKELESAGCLPGNLILIVMTHGDPDHTGNCVYLRQKYGAKIAMHPDEFPAAVTGDMFASRKNGSTLKRLTVKAILFLLGLGRSLKFTPDLAMDEKFDLSTFGLKASTLHLPGHSNGSIGILTDNGDLFCGDLMTNTKVPAPGNIVDDSDALRKSIKKLDDYAITTVYPGHGKPFSMDEFKRLNHKSA